MLYDGILPAFKALLYMLIALILSKACFAQDENRQAPVRVFTSNSHNPFGTQNCFVANQGQYAVPEAYKVMGKPLFGYEGFDQPVLFTKKGLIHFQTLPLREGRTTEKEGEEQKANFAMGAITMEWLNMSPGVKLSPNGNSEGYHTYGTLKSKAVAFKELSYNSLYPGIDVKYAFTGTQPPGFEYTIVVSPGSDVSVIRMGYKGSGLKIIKNIKGGLNIISGPGNILHSKPLAYYLDNKQPIAVEYIVTGYVVRFHLGPYDHTRTIIIDPFVSLTNTLTGSNGGKAKDIDFDYDGNIYVTGGGGINSTHSLAKYNSSGILQWTFRGTLLNPSFYIGSNYGGSVVDKFTGSTYLGQGYAPNGKIIRIATDGLYDDFITQAFSALEENWKMLWFCNIGNPQIMSAGGSTSSSINLAILAPPSQDLTASNITGINSSYQDISDILLDPYTNEMYSIFSSQNPYFNNRIYKHSPPYSATDITWTKPSGFDVLSEAKNRPYLTSSGVDDNSSNCLAINSHYLFYWDGQNLQAYDKVTGDAAGAALTISSNMPLNYGGVYADECNNVFIGSGNGVIKVYTFDGSSFNDAAAPDISIAGNSTSAVYDLVYDNAQKEIYACGQGFVAAIDVSSYCANTIYSLSVISDCATLSMQATLTPTPPPGSSTIYSLYNGNTFVESNTTGHFINLAAGNSYTVRTFVNQSCSGIQTTSTFSINCGLGVTVSHIDESCGRSNGSITAIGVNGTPPYLYALNGGAFGANSTFQGLPAANYTVSIKDVTGKISTNQVTINNLPAPHLSVNSTPAICNLDNGTITGSGSSGKAPYKYSLDNVNYQFGNVFSGIAPNSYTMYLKDVNGCATSSGVTVTRTTIPVKIFAGTDTTVGKDESIRLEAVDLTNSGFTKFNWSPAFGLDNASIKNPLATVSKDITYTITASTPEGCQASDDINIKIFSYMDIFVPNAFTPNADGANDVLKVFSAGLKQLNHFSVYNQWGELVFVTSDLNKGWDGTFKGKNEPSGVYVWVLEAEDHKGTLIRKKGSVVLVR